MKLLALIEVGFLMLITALVALAPEGYEDETGFHYGRPKA